MANGDNPGGNNPGNDPKGFAKQLAEEQKYLDETAETRTKRLEQEKELIAIQRVQAKNAGDIVKANFLANEERLKGIELEKTLIDLAREKMAEEGTYSEIALKELEKREKQLKKNIEATAALAGIQDRLHNIIKASTGIGDQWKNTLVGSLVVAGDIDEAISRINTQMKEQINLANVLGSGLQRMAQATVALALAQDQALAQFSKATSTMGEYNDQIIAIERANVGFGISTADAANAVGALLTNVTTYAGTDKVLQAQLANTAARMEKLGVSTQLTAQTMENAMLVLGMTEKQSMGLTSSLADMAIQMRLPIEEVTENFNAAMPVLAKFGRDAPDVFKKIQVASRSLGVEVGQLLNTMGQFDTFEGAAQAAGKLNTILGGDLLNSAELLAANEADRLRMVREAISVSGRQFENMERFEKLAVANALGVQDIATATKMLSGDMDRFGDALNASGLTKEETEARIRATQSITEKLHETFRMFAITMRPVVELLHGVLNIVFELNLALGGALVPGILAAASAVKLLTVASAPMFAQFKVGLAAFLAFTATLKALEGLTGPMWTTVKVLTALAFAAGALWVATAGPLAAPMSASLVAALGALSAAFGLSALGMKTGDLGAMAGTDFGMKSYQEGGLTKKGRPFIAGDGGTGARPEVIVPGADGAVRRNEELKSLARAATNDPVVQAGASRPAASRDLVVIIEMDKREMGRGVVKAIDDLPGYNMKGSLEYA